MDSSKVKSLFQRIERVPYGLKYREKNLFFWGHAESRTKKSSLSWRTMSKDQKWLGYRHHVAMVTIAPSIPLPKQQKEGNWNDQIEEEDESIEPTQAQYSLTSGGEYWLGWRANTYFDQWESFKEKETYHEFLK